MTRDELIEKMARAIHETMSAQAVIEYLDNPFDASAIAQAALTAIEAAGLCIVPREASAELAEKAFPILPNAHLNAGAVRSHEIANKMRRAAYRALIEAGRI